MNSITLSSQKSQTYESDDGSRITRLTQAECGEGWSDACVLKIEGLRITGRPDVWFISVAPAPVLAWVQSADGREWEEILIDESTKRDRRQFWNTTELSAMARQARSVITKALDFREREDPDRRQALPTREIVPTRA